MTTEQRYGRVFPLYVPPIDWYFLCDDSRSYPMVFYIELRFSGTIHRPGLATALNEALYRHPLLFSVVRPDKHKRLRWVLAPEQMPAIFWDTTASAGLAAHGEYLDVRAQPGLRIWGVQSDNQTRLTLEFHHAATDGTGAYRFIGDWLACYMQTLKCCENQIEFGNLDFVQLKHRSERMRGYSAGEKPVRKFLRAMHEGRRQFLNRVEPLRLPVERPSSADLPGIVNQRFHSQQLATLRKTAADQGLTVNDLLLISMFRTIQQWNGNTKGRPMRVLVPSDTRDGDDFELPACNMTTYNFIALSQADMRSEQQLLDAIRQATLEIKRGDLQKSFMDGLTTSMQAPYILPFLLKHKPCFATCVLSNAGDPSRRFTCRLPKIRGRVACDEFCLESITGVPPLRRNTHCTLSSSTYGRELTFSMRCSPQSFRPEDTQQLLQMFCQNLRI
ncbi:MAG: hypothetical protein NXI32_27850 [bacterium]|nr:hypothetical protein [bacterium]